MKPKIVTICGTSRPGNYTSHALAIVNDELIKKDLDLTSFDGRTLALAFPGRPETTDTKKLRTAIEEASGVVIATPEYHGSFAAMTKLIIENLGYPSSLAGKPVALLGVAGGRIGAIKTIEQLRGVCSHTGAIVIPGAVSIAGVRSAFDADGSCKDKATEESLRKLARSLLTFLREYVYPKYALEAMVREESTTAWCATI